MSVETLTYAALAERLKISPEAARSLAKRHRLPRSRSNDGKTLVTVDLAEIQHTPLPARTPPGHQEVTAPLKAEIEQLQAKIKTLNDGIAKLETTATGHRADFERERERAEKLVAEMLTMTTEVMLSKETAARLEGELAALKRRTFWQRLVG